MKLYVREEERNEEERKYKKASYKRVIDMYVNNMVLCNNIDKVDYDSVWENVRGEILENHGEGECIYKDIFQFYLCNLDEYSKDRLVDCGVILSYSNELDLDIIMVDHFGTSWDYVLTEVDLVDTYEESVEEE